MLSLLLSSLFLISVSFCVPAEHCALFTSVECCSLFVPSVTGCDVVLVCGCVCGCVCVVVVVVVVVIGVCSGFVLSVSVHAGCPVVVAAELVSSGVSSDTGVIVVDAPSAPLSSVADVCDGKIESWVVMFGREELLAGAPLSAAGCSARETCVSAVSVSVDAAGVMGASTQGPDSPCGRSTPTCFPCQPYAPKYVCLSLCGDIASQPERDERECEEGRAMEKKKRYCEAAYLIRARRKNTSK